MNTAPPAPAWAKPSMLGRVMSWATTASPVTRWALIAVGVVGLIGWAGFATQTIRLEGFQLRVPLIGSIGPQGWIPYAEELEGSIVKVTLQRDEANANHRQTKQNYREAQAEAAQMLEAQNARIESQHKEKVDEIKTYYKRRLDSVVARERRMRQRYLQARTDAERKADASKEAKASRASGIAEASGCYGVSGRRPYLVQIRCDRIASEQAAQLIALQKTVKAWPDLEVIEGGPE